MKIEKVYSMSFAKVYPLLVNKTVRKGRTTNEVDQVIQWLTGYDSDGLKAVLDAEASYGVFFAKAPESKKDNRHNLRREGREYRRASYAGNKELYKNNMYNLLAFFSDSTSPKSSMYPGTPPVLDWYSRRKILCNLYMLFLYSS